MGMKNQRFEMYKGIDLFINFREDPFLSPLTQHTILQIVNHDTPYTDWETLSGLHCLEI
jgi:hypothetical protein